jgi:hypothetical protein
LERVLYRVAIEAQLVELLGHGFDIMRMAVSDADDSVTSIEIQILLSLVIPHMASLAVVDGYVEKWIYVK